MEDYPNNQMQPEEARQSLPEPSSNAVPTPLESNSDFYNTPLTGQTPVYPAVNTASGPDEQIETPHGPAPAIPGLSIQDNAVATKPLEEDDTRNKPELLAETQSTENVQNAHDSMNTTSGAIQAAQVMKTATGTETTDTMETEETTVDQPMTTEEEHPEWEVDSSPYESSSESSSDSSDDSDEDEEDYPILSAEETARILMQAEGGSDDEGDAKMGGGSHIRTANEQAEVAPPIPDITVTPDMKIVPLGYLETLVENIILIKATVSGDYQVLESNSLLCLEDRTVIGVVADTLGRVEEPLYTVRYQDPAKIQELGLAPGKQIYYVESHSEYVFTQPLKGMKGSDASNFHDEEVAEDEIEFSDDEAEAEYKRRLKQKKKEKRDGALGGKQRKEIPGPSPLGRAELNYDDDEDRAVHDGYTPLARPKNYHEMMGHQEAHMEASPAANNRGNFRGRGRGRGGFDRGSGRGRGGDNRGRGNHHNGRRPDTSQYQNFSAPPQAAFPAQQYAQYPSYPQQAQQQVQPQFPHFGQAQAAGMPQFPFQMPFQQNPYPNLPVGAHINPAFFAALQQHQQPPPPTQPVAAMAAQPQPGSYNQTAFSQVQAQLDILRQLAGNGSVPPR
ncbi:hypothetical protein UA08_00920 [Talaromyces atroroseus]|uniref:H/ACA ribonucleoprotein complex non-core subunit NAF1 n=1 Tax=Talaromyces atroroseus TaxID=1441469 RepID=A0A225AVN0_TALAT|nr:hypothetical protein UA08_00920 [Talaromyces atroroseus]OKL63673.1 hypothetical protein UA08_00920 [Talaromyces atroroseus]